MTRTQQTLKEIREFKAKLGLNNTAFARKYQLPESTVRYMDRETWNPPASTLVEWELRIQNSQD